MIAVFVPSFFGAFQSSSHQTCTLLQRGVNDNQMFACERNYGIFSSVLLLDSPVPWGKIGITLSGNDPGSLTKHAFYIRIAFGDRGAFAFPGTFIITRTYTSPGSSGIDSIEFLPEASNISEIKLDKRKTEL